MKIDLHCHTIKAKNGDPETRDVDALTFKQVINNANVKIVAITNHNVFDKKQYEEFVDVTNNDFLIWPGIELDVFSRKVDSNGNRLTGHVIIVSNPDYVSEFDISVRKIIKDVKPDDVKLSVEDFLNFYRELNDAIILVHFFKDHSLDEETINVIREGIDEKFRFFYEPASYRSLGILNNHDHPSLMGSDVKDWNKYPTDKTSELKLDVDSFKQFIFLAKKDYKVVETLLNKKSPVEIDISYKNNLNKNSNSKSEMVKIYDDINIIFGTKGTGKTDVLNRIKSYFDSKNIDYSYYEPSKIDDEINNKLVVKETDRNLTLYGLNDCASDFEKISVWKEGNITQIKKFIDYYKTKDTNKNKTKLKVLNVQKFQGLNENAVTLEKNTLVKIDEIKNKLFSIELSKYICNGDIHELDRILKSLENRAQEKFKNEWCHYESKNIINKFIGKIKDLIAEKTETVPKPSETGLFNFCNNRFELISLMNSINDGFKYSIKFDSLLVGKLEENKTLYLLTKRKMLDKTCKSAEFNCGINDLKQARNKIESVIKNYYKPDLSSYVCDLNAFLQEKEITSLNNFLSIKKTFALSSDYDADDYRPSTGEATMIVLQEKLNEDKEIFILDEPEKSLGNTYVNEIIVPKLISLGKKRKTVIVVTHNANIAVRTFPYTSILKTYNNGVYQTFVGNPFTNKLISTTDSSIGVDWKMESLKILEGGKEAFEERGEIYGKENY